ncbi:hypothetical protein, partial [Aquiflexum sp.]|uniref:hypothetical protein n=1 Tax=Aquiflexum sp. TaxID=1872584 RepID=UPI003594833E
MKPLTGIFKIIFAFVAFAMTLAESPAQELFDAGYPPITNYLPKEYGGFPANWAITQDERGIIFVGNSGGLMEFDGISWRMHPVTNNTDVRSLAGDGQGKIYAGSKGELGYFEPEETGKITYFSLVEYLPANSRNFTDLVMQTHYLDGVVYFKAGRNIFIWDTVSEEFTVVKGKSDFLVSFLANARIYVMEWGTGLTVLNENHTLGLVPGGGQFANESIYSILPFPGKPGTLLVTTRNMGLFTFDGQKFEPFYTEADDFLKENLIFFHGTILSDETILLGTTLGGAVIIDRTGKILGHYDKQAGISNNFIGYTFQDRSGMVWLATNNGISILDHLSPLRFFDGRNQILNDVYDIIRSDSYLYLTSLTEVYRLEAGSRNFQKFKNLDLSWQFITVAGENLVISSDGVYAIAGDDLKPIRKSVSNENFVIFKASRCNPGRV